MRLLGPDTVLFAVGLFLFLGAGYGMVQLEDGGEGGLNTYQVTWTTSAATQTLKENIGASASESVTFRVTEGNLTKVTLTFTCSDSNPAANQAPVRFTADVTAPTGDSKKMEGTCGSPVTATFELAEMPADTNVVGNEQNAKANAAQQAASDLGVGEWTIEYETDRDDNTGLIGGAGGANGKLDAKFERYEPRVTMVPR